MGCFGGGTEVESHTYYYYKIKFAHNCIDPSQEIVFYDAFGAEVYTLAPYSPAMSYGTGILSVPGTEQNSVIESISTATYYVYYSTSDLVIDYHTAEFKINKELIKTPAQTVVRATFEYLSIVTPVRDIASVIDGKWDTQVQTEFFSEPPTGYAYGILDLGAEKHIQAMDIIAGFYQPDAVRKFDIDFNITLQYSLDAVNFYDISPECTNVKFTGGSSQSFEENDLGTDFSARYLKVVLEDVKRIDYKSGVWVVAFTEIAAYDNIVLTSEITLIPTTYLSDAVTALSVTVPVDSTYGFASSGTAYIENTDGTFDDFAYTGITTTSFTGVTGISENHSADAMVAQSEETDTTLYDRDCLFPQLKDRLYKANKVDENTLYSSDQLNYVAKEYLKEFYKNHSKLSVNVVYAPHLQVGQTIKVIDPYNDTDDNYFIEQIDDQKGFYALTLARYPQ